MFRRPSEKTPAVSKQELFANTPVPKALYTMAIPTIISQLINLIYNMVDAFFIGRTGNSYMMAATSLTLTLIMMNVAMSNLFGIGGGSLVARLMGTRRFDDAKKVSAFSAYGALAIALFYSLLVGLFLDPSVRYYFGAENQPRSIRTIQPLRVEVEAGVRFSFGAQ